MMTVPFTSFFFSAPAQLKAGISSAQGAKVQAMSHVVYYFDSDEKDTMLNLHQNVLTKSTIRLANRCEVYKMT